MKTGVIFGHNIFRCIHILWYTQALYTLLFFTALRQQHNLCDLSVGCLHHADCIVVVV